MIQSNLLVLKHLAIFHKGTILEQESSLEAVLHSSPIYRPQSGSPLPQVQSRQVQSPGSWGIYLQTTFE